MRRALVTPNFTKVGEKGDLPKSGVAVKGLHLYQDGRLLGEVSEIQFASGYLSGGPYRIIYRGAA